MQSTATDNAAAAAAASAASSSAAPAPTTASTAPAPAPAPPPRKKKPKKRKDKSSSTNADGDAAPPARKKKKGGRRGGNQGGSNAGGSAGYYELPGLSAAQLAVNEQMRRALEEDQYSALGSIVDTATDSEDDEAAAVGPHNAFLYRGAPVRLDRAALQQAIRKHNLLERLGAAGKPSVEDEEDDDEEEDDDMDDEQGGGGGGTAEEPATTSSRRVGSGGAAPNQKKKKTRSSSKEAERSSAIVVSGSGGGGIDDGGKKKDGGISSAVVVDPLGTGTSSGDAAADDDLDRDGGSIFGQTTGSSNSTWVECDKCKKWRRLRGVVDEKKLPSKWYCSMNKNDPERARCSAPEEEYETQHTPESAADARTRKHLRVWVRRLQCNESYEARQPTLTRGAAKKRASTSSSKDPYEWVRCCNAACGKWRACLRIMDAKSAVIDRCAPSGEWYCVMNTWDEKIASCAAPQENLPAVGNLPAWVMQDENSN